MPQKGDWMLPSRLFKGGGRIACSRMGAKVQSLLQVDGWMLNPAVLQGDLLPCSKKKRGIFQNAAASPAYFPSHVQPAAANIELHPGCIVSACKKTVGVFAQKSFSKTKPRGLRGTTDREQRDGVTSRS